MRRTLMDIVSAAAAAVFLLPVSPSVAGPGHGGAHSAETPHALTGGRPGTPADVDRTIPITAKDIGFTRSSLKVRPGETIRFVVTNTGTMIHDFTIGTRSAQRAHRQEMAALMADGHDTAGALSHHAEPNAVMLAPGEKKELIWTFEEAANLEFACNVPGHYETGMKGTIIVE